MEQRASALQARLEARRNMFLKTDNNATYGVNNKPATNATASSGRTPNHYSFCLNWFLLRKLPFSWLEYGHSVCPIVCLSIKVFMLKYDLNWMF